MEFIKTTSISWEYYRYWKNWIMEEVYSTIQLNKDIEIISEVVERFYNMIWCQQNNSFNFDKLNKTEQIQLIGIYKDAAQLKSDLLMYKSWFKK